MTRFFRSGSFGYGTSVSGFSDVDYFAVVPRANLKADSNRSLEAVAAALRTRFPLTGVKVDSPAVIIPFGQTNSERHEIIPCDHLGKYSAWELYDIPNRVGGWMRSSPEYAGAIIDHQHSRLLQKAKPVIRLIKAWKYFSNIPLRSFYIEIAVANYLATQSYVNYKYDVAFALAHLSNTGLANIPDPTGGTTPLYACYTTEMPAVKLKLATALNNANMALNEEKAGRIGPAFAYWDRVFANRFPGYY